METEKIAKNIVSKLIKKDSADVTVEKNASDKDLFGNTAEPETGSKQPSDKDLFGYSNSEDRENANLPPEVENSDTSNDSSDTEKLNQGYSAKGDSADKDYSGSGDGPKI